VDGILLLILTVLYFPFRQTTPAGAQGEPWLQGSALVKQAFAVAWQHYNLYGTRSVRLECLYLATFKDDETLTWMLHVTAMTASVLRPSI
jgi:hypothetical protein